MTNSSGLHQAVVSNHLQLATTKLKIAHSAFLLVEYLSLFLQLSYREYVEVCNSDYIHSHIFILHNIVTFRKTGIIIHSTLLWLLKYIYLFLVPSGKQNGMTLSNIV